MDYKEKYEHLLKFIKNLYPHMSDYCKEKTEGFIPELKESEDVRIRKEIIKVFTGESGFITKEEAKKYVAWLEKQGEQKSADKVEPKFKVGNWVRAISSGNIFKILSVNDGLYRVLCYDGVEANYPTEVEKDLAHWTIQDAKEGDVLVYEGEIFLLKLYALWHKIVYHCCYGKKELHIHSIYESLKKEDFENVHPATKEQRELLFQKMKESGYKWDSEKKELKRIDARENLKLDGDLMIADCMIVEQKSTWSEEDERMFTLCASSVKTRYNDGLLTNNEYEQVSLWLKSLKQRMKGK